MRLAIDVSLDYAIASPCDVLLQIEVAALPDQRLEVQDMRVHSPEPLRAVAGDDGIGQRCLARGEGVFRVEYQAVIAIDRTAVDLSELPATECCDLPAAAIPYLLPSRYCEADLFEGFVVRAFAGLHGGALAAALVEWVRGNLDYRSGASTGVTTAMMTFASRAGVCRDFAHLLVALARAGGIPARCVSAYAPGVDPPDFHAVAELWLGGGWRLVDPTGMARCGEIARVVVGRDATDIAFMTVFGEARLNRQRVSVRALGNRSHADRPERAPHPIVLASQRHGETTMTDGKLVDEKALDGLSVAPPDPDDADHIHDPRQQAGQDESIARRLERNPESPDAQLDNALDESMDASDPPSSTQPGMGSEPPKSSGFDPERDAKPA